VRPLRSVIVTEIMSGSRAPVSSNTFSIATMAAFALSVSKMVSSSSRSQPPSTSPRTCSSYASRSASNVMVRNAGSFTSGEMDSVRLVGPIEPATRRGRSGVFVVHSAAAALASFVASTFSSRTSGSSP